jgi:hypothetical protein
MRPRLSCNQPSDRCLEAAPGVIVSVVATAERAPIWIAIFALLTLVGMASVIRVSIVAWSMWKAGDHVLIWLVPGGLLMVGSITWCMGIATVHQAYPRSPQAHDGSLVLQAPESMRRSASMAVVGALLLGIGSVPSVAGGLSTDEVPMTAYRWTLLAALLAVFLGILMAVAFIWRVTRIRFVGDHHGLSWDRIVKPTRLTVPWANIDRLERRGGSLTARWTVVTNDGRELLPMAFDPSVPMSPVAASRLALEIEALRPV